MCNACNNVCCGSDMFGGCGCDGCECVECWSDDDEFGDDCDHDDYELDVLTGRASCTMCNYSWFMSAKELERDQERRNAYEEEQRYWDRVNEGYQRAKDGER